MAHDLHQVETGERIGSIAMRQSRLGQKHRRDHYQRPILARAI